MSSSSSSFSLPSAGGVVSLLNDDRKTASESQRGRHTSRRSRTDAGLQKLNIPSSYSGDRLHSRHNRRDDISASTSESVTPGASPFDSNPSSGSGGESNGTSLTSMHTSADGHSRDPSFGREDKQMASTNNSNSFSSEDNQQEQEANKKHIDLNELGRFHIRLGTSSSSSLSDDGGNEAESQKRRRPSDSRADETVQSRGKVMRRMLDQQRLASSPTPMSKQQQQEHEEEQRRADDHGRRANGPANGQKDVPMNMHRATARSAGGFRGTNELDDEKEVGEEQQNRQTESTSRREREVSNATTSSSTAGGAGRKATNGSQIIDGKKRYPCSFPGCDKTFSTSGHAARHNRIHTGSKPYRCTFPGCNASFSRQDNSLQHYRTHVLHPKSRSGAAVGIDGAAIDPVAIGDGDLANLDPDTIATIQMGRKALEEGTAIAVVQEFIDGNGRKAEAVQRMVGQPKTGRRGSNATQGSPQQSWHVDATQPTHTTTHARRASFVDEPYGGPYSHPWHGHAAPPPPHHMSGHHIERNVDPPRHHFSMDAHYARESEPLMYGPPPPNNVSYAGPYASSAYGVGHAPDFHGAPAPGPPPYAHHRYNGSERGSEMAVPSTYHGEPSHLRRQSYAAQAANTTADFYQSQRDMQAAEEQAYHERMRRSSDAGARPADRYAAARHPMPYQQPMSRSTFAPPPPEFTTPNYQRASSHSSRQSDDGRSISLSGNGLGGGQHRRTVSAAQGYHGPAYGASTYEGGGSGFYREQQWARPSTSTNPTTSPTLSVRSFRSEGPHEYSMRDAGRGSGAALAMLSDMATQNGGAGARAAPAGNAVSPIKVNGVRSVHAPTSLPPPAALSKVPYSSDRSTNILTPPVPALSSQHTAAQPPPYPHMIR